jgi:hypothetical protein
MVLLFIYDDVAMIPSLTRLTASSVDGQLDRIKSGLVGAWLTSQMHLHG